MPVVTIPFEDYVQGLCIIALVAVLFFVPEWSGKLVAGGFIVLVMLFLSGKLLEWIVRALIFLIGLFFTLILKLVRYVYRELTTQEKFDGDGTEEHTDLPR